MSAFNDANAKKNADSNRCFERRSAAAINEIVTRTAERDFRPPSREQHRQRHTTRLNSQH